MLADVVPSSADAAGSLALGQRGERIAMLILAIAAVMIAALGSFTDLDLRMADAMFDTRTGSFPWRHAWIAEQFSHVLLKRALVCLAVAVIALAVWDLLHPRQWSPLRRLQIRILAMSAALIPSVISLLKQVSSSHCPWDIDRYGGTAPYIRLLEALPAGVDAGHCMPAGHASSALWLVAFSVFFLPAQPRSAAVTFTITLTLGLWVGWLQQMRGAHFFTHTLWSAWISCALLFILVQRTRHSPLGNPDAPAKQIECRPGPGL